jgi:hypothetical protein
MSTTEPSRDPIEPTRVVFGRVHFPTGRLTDQ